MPEKLARVDFLPDQWWNGHGHLAHVIGSMALQHRDIGNTHPENLGSQEWYDILTRIGEPLMAYAAGIDDTDGYGERMLAAKGALELFSQWFDHFWD